MITDTQTKIIQTLKQAGVETAVLDARVLMMHVLDVSLEELLMRRNDEFPASLTVILDGLVAKRAQGMPIAKIIGQKEFWGLNFKTTTNTLDPRPDSETLVEAVLEALPDRTKPYRLLDLGTGTGCLLLSLLYELPNATGVGADISEKALSVARGNAQNLKLDSRAAFLQSDWFSKIDGQYDVIISNPPYIPHADIKGLSVDVRDYDPLGALDGGDDGLEPYHLIMNQIEPFLAENAIVAFEFGQGQGADIGRIITEKSSVIPIFYKDLGGIERCVVFKY